MTPPLLIAAQALNDSARASCPCQTPLLSRARAKIPSHVVISLRTPYEATILRDTIVIRAH